MAFKLKPVCRIQSAKIAVLPVQRCTRQIRCDVRCEITGSINHAVIRVINQRKSTALTNVSAVLRLMTTRTISHSNVKITRRIVTITHLCCWLIFLFLNTRLWTFRIIHNNTWLLTKINKRINIGLQKKPQTVFIVSAGN